MDTKIGHNRLTAKKWLVIYTRPRWEKKVDKDLKDHGIESYCPVRTVENQWADRKKLVSIPLFSSYIFVHVNLKEESSVLYTLGVLGYVYYMGRPAVVRDNVIDDIKTNLLLYRDVEVMCLSNLSVGDGVSIRDGVFASHHGKILQIQSKKVLVVLDTIDCALVAQVPVKHITADIK